ncbi:nucleoid-associated protein [Stenotrophomonas rhizophila]|uniref:nucleoid-associated protein n=1 Tax=Stenotrophomonas rhizophila TaxID=216778 RepID=UPI003AF45C8D
MNIAVASDKSPALSIAGLDTANLLIDDIVSHRVFARDSNKVVKPPHLKDVMMILPPEGVDALQQRLTRALGNRSHGIELSIEKVDQESFLQLGAHAIATTGKPDFIANSKLMTSKLSEAQASTSGLSGMVFVIRGRMGVTPRRFVAVIKAELHDGFGTADDGEDAEVTYLKNLALTPSQRLYKVGLLLEQVPVPSFGVGKYDVSNYRCFLFDHLITATETRSAAAYFYQAFLGMGIQKSSKKLTQDFYEYVDTFVKSSALDEEGRWELKEALRVELRSTSTIINVSDFAEANIENEDVREAFVDFMDARHFPKHAVIKDVDYVKAKLRRPRKLTFTSGVKVTIPADSDKHVVEIVEKTENQATLVIRGAFHEE